MVIDLRKKEIHSHKFYELLHSKNKRNLLSKANLENDHQVEIQRGGCRFDHNFKHQV